MSVLRIVGYVFVQLVSWLIDVLAFLLPSPPSAYTNLFETLKGYTQQILVPNPFISWLYIRQILAVFITIMITILIVQFVFWLVEMVRGK